MSGIVTFAKLQPSPVWFRHLCWKALPSAASELILHSRYLYSPGLWATGIVSTNPQGSSILCCRRTHFPGSGVRQPFNTHRTDVVERFSPIHF